MSDELEPRVEPRSDEDEALMSDFADLFTGEEGEGEATAGEAAPGDADEGMLDELDAFLDTFEKDLELPDAGDFDEMNVAEDTDEELVMPGEAERAVALESAELDLAMGRDEELAADEAQSEEVETAGALGDDDWVDELGQGDELSDLDVMLDEESEPEPEPKSEPEPEPSITPAQADLPLDLPEMAAVAAAAATTAAGAADGVSSRGRIPPPAATPALSRTQLIGGAVALSLTLLLSLVALWLGWGMATQIDTLNQNVSELQQRVLAQSRRGTLAPQAQLLGDQLNRLGERVSELAVIVEGPVSHLRESNQQELQALNQRLERLERGAPSHEPAAVVTTRAPVQRVATTPAATSPAVKGGGWVINLLSVTSAKSASEELARLRQQGLRAEQQKVSEAGRTWYRLRITGFDSYAGAKAYIETIEQQTGFRSAWVAKE
ncbi:MAG: SPOR domain-containing protein [Gammaproteobacteria bacterium]|nr:SPOR domain-containing protein [Gammaproteobacteria bacterium]